MNISRLLRSSGCPPRGTDGAETGWPRARWAATVHRGHRELDPVGVNASPHEGQTFGLGGMPETATKKGTAPRSGICCCMA